MVGYLFVQAYEEKRKRGESKKKERSLGTKKTNFSLLHRRPKAKTERSRRQMHLVYIF